MKDKMMQRKHDSRRSKESTENTESYRHVLKERHYKDDEKNKRKRDKSSDSHKRKRSLSPPHQSSHRKPSPLSKSAEAKGYASKTHHRSHKYESDINESYEELSRRKRKLESELRALDMEEAAEREAENKKSRRDRSDKSTKKDVPEIKIKKEPVSDDERNYRKSSNDDRKSSNDDRKLSNDDRKLSYDERKSSNDERKLSNDERKSSNDERKSSNDERKSSIDERKSSIDERNDRKTSNDKRNDGKLSNDKRRDRKSSNDANSNKRSAHNDRSDKKSSKSQAQHTVIKTEKDRLSKSESSSSEDEIGWGQSQQETKTADKEKPNFATSGKLAEETNTYNGVLIKYNEPSEARKPKRRWRLYPFKGDSDLPFIPIHRQSAYLFGRTRLIADIPIDHPSCSKQHAVLQFRLVPYKREDGSTGRRVRPYVIDLESSNGTFVNNSRINPRCYVELVEKDVVKFGYSSREYVILHEESKNSEEDDDVIEGEID